MLPLFFSSLRIVTADLANQLCEFIDDETVRCPHHENAIEMLLTIERYPSETITLLMKELGS